MYKNVALLRTLNFMEIGLKFSNPTLTRCVLGFAWARDIPQLPFQWEEKLPFFFLEWILQNKVQKSLNFIELISIESVWTFLSEEPTISICLKFSEILFEDQIRKNFTCTANVCKHIVFIFTVWSQSIILFYSPSSLSSVIRTQQRVAKPSKVSFTLCTFSFFSLSLSFCFLNSSSIEIHSPIVTSNV